MILAYSMPKSWIALLITVNISIIKDMLDKLIISTLTHAPHIKSSKTHYIFVIEHVRNIKNKSVQ